MTLINIFKDACFKYVIIIAAMYVSSNWLGPLFLKEKGNVPELLPIHTFALTSLTMLVITTASTYYFQENNEL